MEYSKDWGCFKIILADYLAKNNISKNRIATAAHLQRTQLNAYCKNDIKRPDLNVLARICCVLECELDDILKYVPPMKSEEKNG